MLVVMESMRQAWLTNQIYSSCMVWATRREVVWKGGQEYKERRGVPRNPSAKIVGLRNAKTLLATPKGPSRDLSPATFQWQNRQPGAAIGSLGPSLCDRPLDPLPQPHLRLHHATSRTPPRHGHNQELYLVGDDISGSPSSSLPMYSFTMLSNSNVTKLPISRVVEATFAIVKNFWRGTYHHSPTILCFLVWRNSIDLIRLCHLLHAAQNMHNTVSNFALPLLPIAFRSLTSMREVCTH